MWYHIPAREQYMKEEARKQNQLQATCIRDKRTKTWIQSESCATSNKCPHWRY